MTGRCAGDARYMSCLAQSEQVRIGTSCGVCKSIIFGVLTRLVSETVRLCVLSVTRIYCKGSALYEVS
jgi:hypothetical protein